MVLFPSRFAPKVGNDKQMKKPDLAKGLLTKV